MARRTLWIAAIIGVLVREGSLSEKVGMDGGWRSGDESVRDFWTSSPDERKQTMKQALALAADLLGEWANDDKGIVTVDQLSTLLDTGWLDVPPHPSTNVRLCVWCSVMMANNSGFARWAHSARMRAGPCHGDARYHGLPWIAVASLPMATSGSPRHKTL
jgi:hypothetical protein